MRREERRILEAGMVGCVLATLAQTLLDVEQLEVLAKLGEWLRARSLSGAGGNILAWALVLAVSALPALGLLWKGRCHADWLLLLAGGELFAGLYVLVNPGLVYPGFPWLEDSAIAQGWGLAFLGCVAGTLIAWALLRLLKHMESTRTRLLPAVLIWAGRLYAAAAAYQTVITLTEDISTVLQGNSDPGRVAVSRILLAVNGLLQLAPQILGGMVLVWGSNLAWNLILEPFDEYTVTLAERLTARCARVAKLSLLLAVAGNVLQLVCMPIAALVKIRIQLPVLTLALCAVLFLLCRYFRQAKDISDDNATII